MPTKKKPFDENIICPFTGADLFLHGKELVAADCKHRYETSNDILHLFANLADTADAYTHDETSNKATYKVQDFYTEAPFPNYNEFDDISTFVERANQGIFARILRDQIPMNSTVLEVGCGTAQLSNYLASTSSSHFYAADMTLNSLKLGVEFAKKNNINGIKFLQMNLFHPCIKPQSMDVVISNGVLHHTANCRAAFESISHLVKPGGYFIIGLYNKIGRLRTDLRRHLYKMFGERILFLDPHLRKNLSPDKRRAWILDQYLHPQETKHTMSETLEWFSKTGIRFISSIPKVKGNFTADEKIFEPKSPGTPFERAMVEYEMLFSHYGGEGGLYIMIGQKT